MMISLSEAVSECVHSVFGVIHKGCP